MMVQLCQAQSRELSQRDAATKTEAPKHFCLYLFVCRFPKVGIFFLLYVTTVYLCMCKGLDYADTNFAYRAQQDLSNIMEIMVCNSTTNFYDAFSFCFFCCL